MQTCPTMIRHIIRIARASVNGRHATGCNTLVSTRRFDRLTEICSLLQPEHSGEAGWILETMQTCPTMSSTRSGRSRVRIVAIAIGVDANVIAGVSTRSRRRKPAVRTDYDSDQALQGSDGGLSSSGPRRDSRDDVGVHTGSKIVTSRIVTGRGGREVGSRSALTVSGRRCLCSGRRAFVFWTSSRLPR
jgi:hypothetical protein